MSRCLVIVVGVLLQSVVAAEAATIGVPGDQPTIQAGIDVAAAGDTVLVAPGTYTGPGNKNLDFGGTDVVLRSEAGAENTVIDCEGDGRAFHFRNGETEASVVRGFTVTGGFADYGGGIYCGPGVDPVVAGCRILGNASDRDGGGIYCYQSSPKIFDSVISGNESEYAGGGLFCGAGSNPEITRCTIEGNDGESSGGGVYCLDSSPTIRDCVISANRGDDDGGGLYCRASSPVIAGCVIDANFAEDDGGGLYCSASSPVVSNCTILANWVYEGGGGISCRSDSAPRISNCVIAQNRSGWGGGINTRDSGPLVVNCTITGNIARTGAGIEFRDSAAKVSNCVLWRNDPDEVYVDSGSAGLNYCNVLGGYDGEGNIDEDPAFRSRRGFEFLLGPTSPCVDTGDPDIEDRVSDWHPRWPENYMNGARSDMGAYGGPGNVGWLNSLDRVFSLTVPAGAPSAVYEFRTIIGVPSMGGPMLWDDDVFDVEVVGNVGAPGPGMTWGVQEEDGF